MQGLRSENQRRNLRPEMLLCLLLLPAAYASDQLPVDLPRDDGAIRWSQPVFLERFQVAGPRAYARTQPEGVHLLLDHEAFLAGQRWLEFWIDRTDEGPRGPLAIEARLADPLTDETWERSTYRLVDDRVFGQVDRRAVRGREALLDLAVRRDGEVLGRHRVVLSQPEPAAVLPAEGIPLRLDFPQGLDAEQVYPFTAGVPFAPDQYWGDGPWRLETEAGQGVAHQTAVAATWDPQGSVKWLRVEGLSRPVERLWLRPAEVDAAATAAGMVQETAGGYLVDTGVAQWELGGSALVRRWVYQGQERLLDSAPGLYVRDQHDTMASADPEDIEWHVAQDLPAAAALRARGAYRTAAGDELARYTVWFEFRKDWPGVKATHTLILSRDTNETWLREVGWRLALPDAQEAVAVTLGLQHGDLTATQALTLGAGERVSLAQSDHVQFGGGTNRVEWFRAGPTAEQRIAEREGEIGGWLAWAPQAEPGLLLHCRRAARLHPKEMQADEHGITLKLFSPRGGEELDFRIEACLARWNRGGLLETPANRARVAQLRAEATSNAIGWSRTHEILLWPFAPEMLEQAVSQATAFEEGIYALADPAWIEASGAMGPLHPKDPERFPEAEARIERGWGRFENSGYRGMGGQYGFIDYFAGPRYRDRFGQPRQKLSYYGREAAWWLYARSGERSYGAFAEGTWLSYMDLYLAHADGPGKTAGIPVASPGRLHDRFLFHWESYTRVGNTPWIEGFLHYYYLMGSRRAQDVIENFSRGMQRWLETDPSIWRRLANFMVPLELYQYDWCESMRGVFERYLQMEYDPETLLGRSLGVSHHTASKIRSDNAPLVAGWQAPRYPRLYDLAQRISRRTLGGPLGGGASRHQRGRVGHFLYEDGYHPNMVLEHMALGARIRSADPRGGASWAIGYLSKPYVLSLLAAHDADRRPYASYAGGVSHGAPLQVLVRMPAARQHSTKGGRDIHLWVAGAQPGGVRLQVAPGIRRRNANLQHVTTDRVFIPRDNNAGIYHLTVNPRASAVASADPHDLRVVGEGTYGMYVMADDRLPLVVFAPQGWQPAPGSREAPRMPIFFSVPEGSAEPWLHTTGTLRLWTPAGEPYPLDGKEWSGTIALPAGQHGLWSLRVVEDGLLTTGGDVPPVFAVRDPEAWFNPFYDWPELLAQGGEDDPDDDDEEDNET